MSAENDDQNLHAARIAASNAVPIHIKDPRLPKANNPSSARRTYESEHIAHSILHLA